MKLLLALAAALSVALLGAPAGAAAAIDGYLAVDDGETGQIYTLTQLGTNVTQVTHVGPDRAAITPRWSPDGQRIAFVTFSFTRGHDRIYTMAADGSDVQRLRDEGPTWNNDAPDYFPDGTRIVFARCRTNGSGCVLATVRLDGTGLHTLTALRFEVYDVAASVSPDGTRIAFIRFNANGIHAQVWLMNTDGSDAHAVTPPVLEPYEVEWSPDGTRLSVSSNCCKLGGNVYTLPASGGRATQVTHTPYPNFSGSAGYAPSGREIAFITDRNYPDKCCTDLYLMRFDGAHQVKVSTGLTGVRSVDWGPSPLG